MVLVHDTLNYCTLDGFEVSTNSFKSIQLTDRIKLAFSYVTRETI